MENPDITSPFTDRHDVVKTVCVWKNGHCYRIEIIQRAGMPQEPGFACLVWKEEERNGTRILARDVTFPWVHHQSAEAALDQALESLAAKIEYPVRGEAEV